MFGKIMNVLAWIIMALLWIVLAYMIHDMFTNPNQEPLPYHILPW